MRFSAGREAPESFLIYPSPFRGFPGDLLPPSPAKPETKSQTRPYIPSRGSSEEESCDLVPLVTGPFPRPGCAGAHQSPKGTPPLAAVGSPFRPNFWSPVKFVTDRLPGKG
jgi:hypothetical protein